MSQANVDTRTDPLQLTADTDSGLLYVNEDTDSGFVEDTSILDCSQCGDQACTIDHIVHFIRGTHIVDNREPCFNLDSDEKESVFSSLSSNQSEDRKSVLKSASSYKRKNLRNIKSPEESSNPVKTKNASCRSKTKSKVTGNVERSKSSPVKRNVSINPPDSENTCINPLCMDQSSDSHQRNMKIIGKLNSWYDSRLERSKSFLHGQSKVFSKASQYLTPAKPGLRNLQVCYSKTNMELNSGKIFGDLVKTAHKQNIVICDSVNSIERRLYRKRTDPLKKTTYYRNMNKPDPFRLSSKPKKAQTVAEKQKERKERITETTEEIKLGFKRKAKTVKLLTQEEIEKLKQCRYLRLDPNF